MKTCSMSADEPPGELVGSSRRSGRRILMPLIKHEGGYPPATIQTPFTLVTVMTSLVLPLQITDPGVPNLSHPASREITLYQ
jgi:hypothetical protein